MLFWTPYAFLLGLAAVAGHSDSLDAIPYTAAAIEAAEMRGSVNLIAHLKYKYGGKIPEGVDVLAEMKETQLASQNKLKASQGNRDGAKGIKLGEETKFAGTNGSFDWKQCKSEVRLWD